MDKTLRLAFYRIVKTLMRILYRKGVALGDFTQLVKQAYVEVVEQELAKTAERVTTSRIAVITGLTRKDVALLRQADTSEPKPRFNRSLRVVNGWLHDVDFWDAATGYPAKLAFRGKQGSFEQLVQRYSGDMSCFAMLDELKRVGMVQETADGLLELLNTVYIPQGNESEKLQLMGNDVALLISTIDHNMTVENAQDLRYQRKVSYNNLPEEVLPEFREFVKEDAQALLVRFNAWLYQRDRDSNPNVQGSGRMQAGVGIYYFEQTVETATQAQDAAHEN
ncbi:MAG: hypothetical protein RI964_735 [Pseudomonadota bacterium]